MRFFTTRRELIGSQNGGFVFAGGDIDDLELI